MLHSKGTTTLGPGITSVSLSVRADLVRTDSFLTFPLILDSYLFLGKCLYMSGLVPEPLTAEDDYTLIHYGIGFTNMVSRPTKGSADLTRREIKQGSQILLVRDSHSNILLREAQLSLEVITLGNGFHQVPSPGQRNGKKD